MNTVKTENAAYQQDNRAYWRRAIIDAEDRFNRLNPNHLYDYADFYRPRRLGF